MNEIINPETGEIIRFKPEEAKAIDVKADALIAVAKKVKDWPLLEQAIDAKIENQREFLVWWDAGPGKRLHANSKVNADRRSPLSMADVEKQTQIKQQQVSTWRSRLKKPEKYHDDLYGSAYRKAMAEESLNTLRGASGTGENEWFTPAEYLDLARVVLGGFDLDPASNPLANEVVRASEFFTAEDDGLTQEWHGRIWLNPPYAQPAISQFADKMVTEWEVGHVGSAIMLTHNYTDTGWFQKLAHAAQALCFTRGRIRFVDPDGELAAPTQGQAFFYFGQAIDDFAEIFAPIGFVAEVRR